MSGALPDSPRGEYVELEGEQYYRISAYDRLDAFLMSVASDTDLWMFVASGGGLTAGRVDPDGALFPYETVDRLHDAHHHTGPVTVIRVRDEDGEELVWEPFSTAGGRSAARTRRLYKNLAGTRVVFEEEDPDLGLCFRYSWAGCEEFGWVRTATLENRNGRRLQIRILDGLRNILPHGAPLGLYQQSSNLVDAYKKSELDEETGLAIYSLTAQITDRAEAREVLRANTVWSRGLPNAQVHLQHSALRDFREGRISPRKTVLDGVRGNYLVSSAFTLDGGDAVRWWIVGDTGRDHPEIVRLRGRLRGDEDLSSTVTAKLAVAEEDLRRKVASADGLQRTAHTEACGHHFSNVLFNIMRGGVFLENYTVPLQDLRDFLGVRNAESARRHAATLDRLSGSPTIQELRELARQSGDADFERLCHEYLPLHFSRRHGDPSRPWNHFHIQARTPNGEFRSHYQGNWRDIFQNWEALGRSFPGFLPNMVAKFLNASTVDGFNPYRITRDGVDWEMPSPEHPWSNIGYWGDHQIIYLLKLLETAQRHDPKMIGGLLDRDIFSYSEVPYRIRPFEELLRDPSATIEFDTELQSRIEDRVAKTGTDGRLLAAVDGAVLHVNLLEKLLVPLLSKLSNLVPDLGIWMNTQRPEWNDANNALAGGGVSVVTLCHLRRHLDFLCGRLAEHEDRALPVSREVVDWFSSHEAALGSARERFSGQALDPAQRLDILNGLGSAFSEYRSRVYRDGFSGREELSVTRVVEFCRNARQLVDKGIAANRRPDGLYHTYHQLRLSEDGAGVEALQLPLMLEGQVAVLSSGLLTPDQALELLEALFASELYRSDARSFLLYPERELPGFLDKNSIPSERLESIPLLVDLLSSGDESLVVEDEEGVHRFQAELGGADDVDRVLTELREEEIRREAVDRDREAVLALFDDTFGHASYTGRSGVMYAYEGLGCIYWHMVAKLLLAVQEAQQDAEESAAQPSVREGLASMYYRIRSGIGYEKDVEEFGAFPTDPYSHTPAQGGARQPGMTGQVKEELLTRAGELGVEVADGCVHFRPTLLRAAELMGRPTEFRYLDVEGRARVLDLPPGTLAFTVCQVPVVYRTSTDGPWIRVHLSNGSSVEEPGDELDAALSGALFARGGWIDSIQVGVPQSGFRRE